jgi:hypothetical protein
MHSRARHWARGALALVLPLTLWVAAAGTAQALQNKAPAPQASAYATGLPLGSAAAAVAKVTAAQRKTTIRTTDALVAEVTIPAMDGASKGSAYDQ